MPPPAQMRWLSTARLKTIIGTLAAKLEIERPLIFLRRLPLVPAFDDELIGRFTGRVLMADLIADDQMALVQESVTIEVSTTPIPNLKIGQRLNQRLLNRLAMMYEGRLSTAEQNALQNWDDQLAENLLTAVRWRMNALACAMMIDSFTYNRWGLKITGATWGMPANLKVTVGTAWSVAATATPISDIWNMDQVASLNYGITYDTVTMTTPDFRNMVATTEFANKASLVLGANFLLTSAAMPTKQDPRTMEIAAQLLRKRIILDDFQPVVKANDGTTTASRALPTGTVLLSRSQDEGNGMVMDMANGVPTESRVADMGPGTPDGLAAVQPGPTAYYTIPPDLNPPQVTAWGVGKAFPRKMVPESTAVLLGV